MARRSLLPREHGAYFQLAIPLIAAWCAQPLQAASVLLGLAACLAFLAHEPLLVLLGTRGPRMQQHDGRRARTWFTVLAIAALATGALGLARAPSATLPFAVAAAALGVTLILLARRGAEHTLHGELIAAAALTGVSAIALVTAGAAQHVAVAWWLGWTLGFGATVIAVHRVLARHRRTASSVDRILAIAGLAASAVLAATARDHLACLLAAPLVAAATLIVVAPPPATRLRAIGIAISIVAAFAGTVAVVSL
jgi:YwiC-like protein